MKSNKPKILLVLETEHLLPLEAMLAEQDYSVRTLLEKDIRTIREISSDDYDVVIFSLHEALDQHVLLLRTIQEHQPKPAVVFTEQCDNDWILAAVNVGANSIVVDGIQAERLENIINIANARFERCMSMRAALRSTQQKLEERRDLERAKGILMKKKQLDEQQAFELLRSQAMNNNQRIGEVAQQFLQAAELLN